MKVVETQKGLAGLPGLSVISCRVGLAETELPLPIFAHGIEVSVAPRLVALLDELKSYPVPQHAIPTPADPFTDGGIVVPLTLASEEGPLTALVVMIGAAVNLPDTIA